MNYIVTPFSHEVGTGGSGGDCNTFCAAKITVCNIFNECGNKFTCFIYHG